MGTLSVELKKRNECLLSARAFLDAGDLEKAESAAREALSLDENHEGAYQTLAEVFQARGDAELATQWEGKAAEVRRRAWQRQVEAEARGHHEVLGKPGRHEIP